MLIKCPVCQENGLTRTLAEFLPNGVLKISRQNPLYAEPMGDYTVVMGNDFLVLCGKCKQIAFRKIPILIQQTTQITFGTL